MMKDIFNEEAFIAEIRETFDKANRFVERKVGNPRGIFAGGAPLSIKKTDTQYTLEIELPGFSKEEVEISINDGLLVIQAERNLVEDSELVHNERSTKIYRSVPLERGVTLADVNAELKNGVLSVAINRKEIPPAQKVEIK